MPTFAFTYIYTCNTGHDDIQYTLDKEYNVIAVYLKPVLVNLFRPSILNTPIILPLVGPYVKLRCETWRYVVTT